MKATPSEVPGKVFEWLWGSKLRSSGALGQVDRTEIAFGVHPSRSIPQHPRRQLL